MNDEDFEKWIQQKDLTKEAVALIRNIRKMDPARKYK